LKILAHKSWNLTKDTLKQVYFALVRSVLEYSSLILAKICKSSFLKIQRIQNCAIKVIHKLPFREHTELVHKISGIEPLDSRLRKFNKNYFHNSLSNKNPLIIDLNEEYKSFKANRKYTG
jgi:hypothetical protein